MSEIATAYENASRCVFQIAVELSELKAIADDLEELGDHFGEKVARYQASGIYAKSARIYDARESILGSLTELGHALRDMAGAERGGDTHV